MAKGNDVAVMDRAPEASGITEVGPVLAVGLGRGRVGKSTALRWLIGRARNAGRQLVVADGDRRNPTLSAFYPPAASGGASRPASAEAEDTKDWLTQRLNHMAEQQESLVLDLGGGDDLLDEFGRDLELVEFCRDVGAQAVALLCLGPDLQDLQHVAAIEETGAFAPERTVILLNEGLVPIGRQADRAFAPIMEHPNFLSLVKRGAQPVLMPRLACMGDVDRRRLDFWQAQAGAKGPDGTPLGPVQRSQVKTWLVAMERVFEPVAGWLP